MGPGRSACWGRLLFLPVLLASDESLRVGARTPLAGCVTVQTPGPDVIVTNAKCSPRGAASRARRPMSDFGSRMGAARLRQVASDAVIVTLRRSFGAR